METLTYGLRRMFTPPARTTHHTPDQCEEPQPGHAQPAGACTDESADASAAAPGRGLLSLNEPRAAPSASSTTSAALQNPLFGPRSGSNPHEPDHAYAYAHDSNPRALTGTNYVPYAKKASLLTSVPKLSQPISSTRSSVQAPFPPVGPVNVDADEDDYPNASVTEGSLAAPSLITLGTSDPSMSGATSCPVQPRLGEVSVPSGPPVNATAIADAHGDDHHLPAAVATCAHDGALITLGTSDPSLSGTTSCPVQPRLGEVSVPSGPVPGAYSHRVQHDRPALLDDVPGSVPAPSAPSSRRSLDGDFAPAADSLASDRSGLPPQATFISEYDGNHQAMLDEIDRLRHRLAIDAAERQKLLADNAVLADRLRLATAQSGTMTDALRPGHATRHSSGAVRPRAGSELGSFGRAADETRARRRLAAAPYSLPPSATAAAVDPAFSRPPSPSVPPSPCLPSSGSPHRPVASGSSPSPSDRPPVPAPPSRRLHPDPPPPHAPYGADVTSPSSLALGACPAWHCDVISPSGHVLTKPLPSWKDSQLLAPRTAAILKSRQSQQSGLERLNNLFGLMARNPGMVASTYSRLIQCLVDHYVSFSSLNGADVGTPALNLETFRFLSDACSATSCPPNVAMCFLECCSSYSSCPDAVPSDSPSHSELLLRHALSSLIFELSPPSTALLEIAFNSATKLADGENIFDFVARIREAASKNNTPQRVVHLRILSAVQEASNNPLANHAVINEVSNRLSAMMTRSESLHSFLSSLKTVAGVGGCLNEPIIHRSPISVVPGDSPHERS